jgi:hypothetical protein
MRPKGAQRTCKAAPLGWCRCWCRRVSAPAFPSPTRPPPRCAHLQIADFVARFIPAYQAYLPGLYAAGPTSAQPGKTLIIEVDMNRSPVAQQPKPVM